MEKEKFINIVGIVICTILGLLIAYDVIHHSITYKECAKEGCKQEVLTDGKFCASHTCIEKDCYLEAKSRNDRCVRHNARYEKEQNATFGTCRIKKCELDKASGSNYCVLHTCNNRNCTNKIIYNSDYCSKHTCRKEWCNQGTTDRSIFCWDHEYKSSKEASYSSTSGSDSETSSSTSNSYSSGSSSYSYSKKKKENKIEMPDCDDYEDYDDFMDDWDGFMPDGSDAEDYWENW